jgi:hypothetical protein
VFRSATLAVISFACLSLVTACSPDSVNEPVTTVSICHISGTTGVIEDINLADLPEHKKHGDYVARLDVDKLNTTGDSIHFRRITDALEVARAGRIKRSELSTAACRITIDAVPGILRGSTATSPDPLFEKFPLVIDVPDVTLRGAFKMQVDAAGRATGTGLGSDATTFAPTPALVVIGGADSQAGVSEEIIVVNAHPTGSKGDRAVIEGFIFQSGHAATDTVSGGQGILSMRVQDLTVRGNRFEGRFTEDVDLRASSGIVERNHLSGVGAACDICLAGPGTYTARDNRLLSGGIPGIFVTPATLLPVPSVIEQQVLPAASTVTALLANNEVKGHTRKPVGTGLRVGAIGVGAPNVAGTTKVTMTGNNLVGNTFGIIVEAAFPVATGLLRGDIEVTTSGNTISGSCQNDLLVSLSRHQTGLGLQNSPYLRNSTFNLTLGTDISWTEAWYSNPAGFGNTVIVNGQTIANGTVASYDASRVCP